MAYGEDEDDWEQDYYSLSTVNLDCLMPNGIIIQMHVDADSTVARIKQLLWTEARKHAFYSRLRDQNLYVLTSINKHAEKIELLDDNQRLSDAELFRWFVSVREKKDRSTKDEKYVSGQIGILMGRSTQQFDSITNPEVSEFRKKMGDFCEKIASDRDRQSWHAENKFLYPPNVSPNLGQNPTDIPPYLANLISGTTVEVDVSYNSRTYERVPLNVISKASEFVTLFLEKWARETRLDRVALDACLLKVCGREDYFYDDYTFIQYTYIRRCIARDMTPKLAILIRDRPPPPPQRRHPSTRDRELYVRTSVIAKPPPPLPPAPQQVTKHRTSWDADVKDDKFKIQVNLLTNGSCPDQAKIQLRLGIYHGSEPMCGRVETQEAPLDRGSARWNETLTFDLKVSDIPRMARLCMTLCSNDRKKIDKSATGVKIKGKKEVIPLAWANIPIFDYQGCMQLGPMPLYFWGVSNDDALKDDALNPIGTVEGNPLKEQCVCVNITFLNYGYYATSLSKHHIYYPSYDKVIERAAELQASGVGGLSRANGVRTSQAVSDRKSRVTLMPEMHLENLKKFVSRDPLAEQLEDDEDECKKIWNLRYEYQFYLPASLPRLLHTVQWNNQANVAEMQALLQVWQEISPTQALELLDFAHADNYVRSYAVKCLRALSDCELLTYLLQLVQVLKYESYIDCDLVRFLLERALHNQTVGHNLFWLLRSEMHVPSVSVRFGLILEAYLKGNIKYLDGLLKQVNHLQRLASICKTIKEKAKGNVSKEYLCSELTTFLDQPQIVDVIRDSACILDPCLKFGNPLSKKCKVMMSKMKPLYLAFKNHDPQGSDIFLMYKKGDDLRQDMLTLQIIRIMDNIWQNVGLDLRLNAYNCLATGNQEGLIEVVTECDTIANIQKNYADGKTSIAKGFSKECIYRWLKEKNPTEEALNRAMEEFTLSCAGYSVATYVLGIGDRHSDNLLLKENGQLLHIDFGHILGHFKQKMGFQRERVPFVLTPDFVYVICRGPVDDTSEFKRFKSLCEKAYMALRQQSHILLVLFLMMVNTGIPELSSLKDSTRGVRFLLTTLLPQESEEKARAHWNAKLTEALNKSFWSSLNNAFHLIAHS